MEAPRCPACGQRHWPRQPCPSVTKVPVTVTKVRTLPSPAWRPSCDRHGENAPLPATPCYTTKMSLRQLRAYIDQTTDPLLQRFLQQRSQAKQRGIPWQLDFWQWLQIWEDSGHLDERGRHRGAFQMCRFADIGPYASSNVRIDRMETNASEGQVTKQRIRLAREKAACATAALQATTTSPST